MLPFLSTATVMFSGLVCVGMLTAFGRSTLTVLLITGMVIRKMISSTNMTSTRGVVLMVAMIAGSEPPEDPTLIDMDVDSYTRECTPAAHRTVTGAPRGVALLADRGRRRSGRTCAAHLVGADARTADQIGMQIACEVPQGIL